MGTAGQTPCHPPLLEARERPTGNESFTLWFLLDPPQHLLQGLMGDIGTFLFSTPRAPWHYPGPIPSLSSDRENPQTEVWLHQPQTLGISALTEPKAR